MMDDLIQTAIDQANASHYLTKAQAKALADEVERLRAQIGDPLDLRERARDAYVSVLEERHSTDSWERQYHCDLCGATEWRSVILMACDEERVSPSAPVLVRDSAGNPTMWQRGPELIGNVLYFIDEE